MPRNRVQPGYHKGDNRAGGGGSRGGGGKRTSPTRRVQPRERATIFDVLRTANARVLETLDALEATAMGDTDRRAELVETLAAQIEHKQRTEEEIFAPLGDDAEAYDHVFFSRELSNDIEGQLERLRRMPSADRGFERAVHLLHEVVRQQVEREHGPMLTAAERVIAPEDAIDLARRL